MKDNGFKLTKERRRYPAHTLRTWTTPMTALLANIPAQAKTLLHSLEQAAAGIGLQRTQVGIHVV